jgi:alpha-galactosidase
MAEKLARFGYNLVTVDIQWYEPNATGFDYHAGAKLEMDEFGRLIPAVNKFPSAADGKGFKPLADYIHAKGLKFGIHFMRGIPRQAVAARTPAKGTGVTAADIADLNSTCKWNSDMYGVDLTKPGAQEYYDSLFEQFAAWGIDFIKIDDLSAPTYHQAEIEAIRKAIDRTGRPIILSTSPGATPLAAGAHVSTHANMWRISDDFWDSWPALVEQFARLRDWTPYRGPGHFPDADMLPLGTISMGQRQTNFTPDEQGTLLSLWSIARSPLILGADLRKLDDATLALITNEEVIAVDQFSANNRELFHRDGFYGWVADIPGTEDRYLALFNTRPKSYATAASATIPVKLSELGFAGACRVRDLWQKKDLDPVTGEFAPVINAHSAGLYRLSAVRSRPLVSFGPVDPALGTRLAELGKRPIRVHDPSTIVKCKDEYWIFYTGRGTPSYHSKDLIDWKPGPRVFEQAPSWVATAVPGNRNMNFWAPDIMYLGNRYLLYYSVSTFGKNTSAIALATNPTLDPADPAYRWTDEGIVVQSSSVDNFNTIDPAITPDAEGRLWLAFGSFWSGIKLIQLDPATGRRLASDPTIYPLAYHKSIEASYIYRHGNFYYLFVNWGICCRGLDSTYEIRVGRSEKITGPYLDKQGRDLQQDGGSLFLATDGPFIGPGHAGIIQEGGKYWLSCHFYDATQGGSPAFAIRPLQWTTDGWPEALPVGAPAPAAGQTRAVGVAPNEKKSTRTPAP